MQMEFTPEEQRTIRVSLQARRYNCQKNVEENGDWVNYWKGELKDIERLLEKMYKELKEQDEMAEVREYHG